MLTMPWTSSPKSSSRQVANCCSSQRTRRLWMFSEMFRQVHFLGHTTPSAPSVHCTPARRTNTNWRPKRSTALAVEEEEEE